MEKYRKYKSKHSHIKDATPIIESTLIQNDFNKKANMWLGHGVSLYLHKGRVWIINKAQCQEKDVKSMEDVFEYIKNPPPYISSKVKYENKI